jgi:hypothetical protein
MLLGVRRHKIDDAAVLQKREASFRFLREEEEVPGMIAVTFNSQVQHFASSSLSYDVSGWLREERLLRDACRENMLREPVVLTSREALQQTKIFPS